MIVDAVVLVLSYFLAWLIRFVGPMAATAVRTRSFQQYMMMLILIVPVYLLLYQAFTLYTPMRMQGRRLVLANIVKANSLGLLILMFTFYMVDEGDFSRSTYIMFYVINIVLQWAVRMLIFTLLKDMREKGLNQKQMICVGYSRAAEEYIDRVQANPQWGYVIQGILDDNTPAGTEYKGIKVLGRIENLNVILPENQMELFRAVRAVNPNVAVVLFNGRPLLLDELSRDAAAILEAWFPGTEGGHAILDLLTGTKNPSGKLPMTFPRNMGQIPIYYNHFSTGRPLTGTDPQRFVSKYTDAPNTPLFPFGYGLSYAEFSYSDVSLSSDSLTSKDSITASVQLKNTGACTGTEVVQLYIQDVAASTVRPVRELKGFTRITLAPGETQTVSFQISEAELAFHRADGSYGTEPGTFRVWIGGSSATENGTEFTLR